MQRSLIKRKVLNLGAIWISYIKLIPDLFRLNKRSLVIDCGANVGHISKLLASTGATVIAFEPDPIAFTALKRRCGGLSNITLRQQGVWDKNASIQMYAHEDATGNETSFTVGSSIISEKQNVNQQNAQAISVIDLIEFMQMQDRKIDLIKLDVEGAEIEILKAIIDRKAWHLFKRMYVETHETKIPSQKATLAFIRKKFEENGITNIKLNWV